MMGKNSTPACNKAISVVVFNLAKRFWNGAEMYVVSTLPASVVLDL